MGDVLFPAISAFVGLAIGIPSYFTWSRRWPGMIAGFDPARCSDVDGLTRWVGGAGMGIGAGFLLAAAVAYAAPQYRPAVVAAIAVIGIAGPVVTMTGCSRFTRR